MADDYTNWLLRKPKVPRLHPLEEQRRWFEMALALLNYADEQKRLNAGNKWGARWAMSREVFWEQVEREAMRAGVFEARK